MKILISPFSRKLRNGNKNPKDYPYWSELIALLKPDHELTQIGVKGETLLTEKVLYDLTIPQLKEQLLTHDLFISVDSFLQHMAHHYGLKGIVIFSQSDPKLFGYPENINLVKDPKYIRKNQFDTWESATYIKQAYVSPEVVLDAVKNWCLVENH